MPSEVRLTLVESAKCLKEIQRDASKGIPRHEPVFSQGKLGEQGAAYFQWYLEEEKASS